MLNFNLFIIPRFYWLNKVKNLGLGLGSQCRPLVITLKNRRMWCEMRRGATCCVGGARCVWGCELLRVRDARVVTLKNRRKWCEMRRGATCCVGGARCVWVRDAHYNVISVLGVRVAAWCEMRIFLGGCESLCPRLNDVVRLTVSSQDILLMSCQN